MSQDIDQKSLDPLVARGIINILGSTGTPPEHGIEHYTVGLDQYLQTLSEEYLQGILKIDYSAFKLIVGSYGGGKTHFLYNVRDLAFKENFVVSYVPLSPSECPFDKLELVYKAIVDNMLTPPPVQTYKPASLAGRPERKDSFSWQGRGIEAFLRTWYGQVILSFEGAEDKESLIEETLETITGIESISFRNAVRGAFKALLGGDEEQLARLLLWIKGEGFDRDELRKYGVMEDINRVTAFRMIRSLIQWVKLIGYSGMVLLFDEAERGMSVIRAREKKIALDNLRQIVDECGNGRLPSCLILYAIPDENQLLEGTLGVYEALRQRLRGMFHRSNPSGAKINLEDLDMDAIEFLIALGEKLSQIYHIAYGFPFDSRELVHNVAKAAYSFRFHGIGHRRLFVKALIQCLHQLRDDPKAKITYKGIEGILKKETAEEREKETKRSDEVEY